jgi:hypothetical protein
MAVKRVQEIGCAVPFFDDDVNATDVLVQAGETIVLNVSLHNVEVADSFLLMFDAAAIGDVTVGTTIPDYVVPNDANGIVNMSFPFGLHFLLGLVIASTTTTNGSTNAAQDVSLAIA